MVDLFEENEEGVEFAEAANTPIPGDKLVKISNLLKNLYPFFLQSKCNISITYILFLISKHNGLVQLWRKSISY